jgi:threonine aldolase
LPLDYQRAATDYAHAHGLATHLDGARLFNAIVRRGWGERDAARGYDSVSICLSKGLGAPAGTVLLGRETLIAAARRWRKALGGGMRQAGILAAAGIYALEHHVARLAEDHGNAEYLAAGLGALGYSVDCPGTNMVYVALAPATLQRLAGVLAEAGILASLGERTRLVTHLDVGRTDLDLTLAAFADYRRSGSAARTP